jgi:ATP-dependent DNA ligase
MSAGILVRRIRTDGFVDPCIPSRAPKPPSGPDWVHEIKHDGYRLIVWRQGEAVGLFTRRVPLQDRSYADCWPHPGKGPDDIEEAIEAHLRPQYT